MPKEVIVLGFSTSAEVESAPGVWSRQATEQRYKADLLTYNKQFDSGAGVIDGVEFRNRYSIVMKDDKQLYADLKYVKIGQVKWKVTALEFLPPRIIITVGGIYNGG